jgi:hypothetical protein
MAVLVAGLLSAGCGTNTTTSGTGSRPLTTPLTTETAAPPSPEGSGLEKPQSSANGAGAQAISLPSLPMGGAANPGSAPGQWCYDLTWSATNPLQTGDRILATAAVTGPFERLPSACPAGADSGTCVITQANASCAFGFAQTGPSQDTGQVGLSGVLLCAGGDDTARCKAIEDQIKGASPVPLSPLTPSAASSAQPTP